MNLSFLDIRLCCCAVVALLLAGLGTEVSAQTYPSRTIRLVVPFAAGGGTDFFARLVAAKLTQVLGQQVVVDNRAGAGGIIGTELVAKAAPDGYTLLMGHTGTLAINPSLYAKIPYDPVRDFSPVSLISISPLVLVTNPSLPVANVKELISLAKRRPGEITFASGGSGTGTHLSAELFKLMGGIDMIHVPYKGTGPALTAGMAGEVATLFSTLPPAMPHIKSGGRLRALAVTGAERSKVVPEIPTMAQSGLPGYESTLRYGVLLPAGASEAIVATLRQAIARFMSQPEFAETLARDGAEPRGSTPEEFRAMIATEVKKWSAVVKAAGVRAD
ncbi:MAG TPA: tripartite tricarboxylate transporter substrate binding protein [Burkholderiales bacterium]|nr:tripartite tricarboxylate transporter substrate binding protein [Burkholderiales bacterium]